MEKHTITEGSLALQGNQCQVITIPATEPSGSITLRVATYARVSSNSEDQENSFAAQYRYYTSLISGTKEWEMVDIYADEGITGTSADKRGDFQRLMADCRRGLIDRVLVKSISRFARNTLECLEAIRELKSIGVSVFFEEQNMDTGVMSSEMLAAIHASFAQTESENISQNMKWGCQKRMQMGTFVPSTQPFGYHLVDGAIQIDLLCAKYVCEIFSLYLIGWNTGEIAKHLNSLQADHPELQGYPWTYKRVARILRNEKYIGDSLWQKSFHTDTLPRKELKNQGQYPQYYAENTHPPIIEKAVYHKAQTVMAQRNQHRATAKKSVNCMRQGILICEHCGAPLRSKTINAIPYHTCRQHDASQQLCSLMPVPDTEIQKAFLRLFYNLKHSSLLPTLLTNLKTVRDRRMLWHEDVIELNKQISELLSQNQLLAELNKHGLIDPDIFIAQTNELAQQLRGLKLQKERLLACASDDTITRTQDLMHTLEEGPDFLEAFDAELFSELIDKIIVENNEHIRFRLKNGLELPETIERTVR